MRVREPVQRTGVATPTIAQSFSASRNSLNFLRLVLAVTVVVSHCIAIGGFAILNGINQSGFGQLAVYGFFGISGYLIAGSALQNSGGRYLWKRFLRIFPAFWVCLIVTAFVIGAIGWLVHPAVPHCGLSCYFNAPRNSPFRYVYRDSLLKINQTVIAGTPPLNWNASIWTLFFEFCCYVLLVLLSLAGFLRHRMLLLSTAVAFWLTNALITFTPSLSSQFNIFKNTDPMSFLKLSAVFLVGSVLYLYNDRIPDNGWLALGCAVVFAASLYLPTGGRTPDFFFTSSDLLAPLVAYPLIWLGIHLPLQRVGHRNDYSYGFYIYGFPISQLLALWGATRWGFVPYTGASVAITMVLAIASWWTIEKHALKLKSLTLRSDPPRDTR